MTVPLDLFSVIESTATPAWSEASPRVDVYRYPDSRDSFDPRIVVAMSIKITKLLSAMEGWDVHVIGRIASTAVADSTFQIVLRGEGRSEVNIHVHFSRQESVLEQPLTRTCLLEVHQQHLASAAVFLGCWQEAWMLIHCLSDHARTGKVSVGVADAR